MSNPIVCQGTPVPSNQREDVTAFLHALSESQVNLALDIRDMSNQVKDLESDFHWAVPFLKGMSVRIEEWAADIDDIAKGLQKRTKGE